jgi:hypothetical protein
MDPVAGKQVWVGDVAGICLPGPKGPKEKEPKGKEKLFHDPNSMGFHGPRSMRLPYR